jgi:hypothetical protein
VRIDVRLPGHELTVNRRHDTDFHVAAREAFEAMTRRLENLARRRREQGWEHGASRVGQVLGARAEGAPAAHLPPTDTATSSQGPA